MIREMTRPGRNTGLDNQTTARTTIIISHAGPVTSICSSSIVTG